MHDYPAPPKPFHFFFGLGSIIKLPAKPGNELAYKDFICTEQDKANIHELIFSLAENSKFSLLMKQTQIKNLGAQINHVHPLKFLAVAMSTMELKSCLMIIFDDYFKKSPFIEGLGTALTREAEKGNLEKHLPAFAAEIGVKIEDMHPYFVARDWEGLVLFLMST